MTAEGDLALQKQSHRSRVERALRAAIVSGEMVPGVVYSAPALGARFGVSATPVREAMLELARDGLVETAPNKGFRVTVVSEHDLDEMTQVRLLIEPPVVRDVTPVVPEADLAVLRRLAQDVVDAAVAGDLIGYTDADRTFHLRLLSYAGNGRITSIVSDLRAHARLYGLASLLEAGQLEAAAREHLEIVDVLAARDADAVEQLMREHIRKTRGPWAHPG